MKLKPLLFLALLFSFFSTRAQLTRVQFINNCPEQGLTALDIYINGNLLVNDLFFRTASPFTDLAAGTPLDIGISEMTSLNVNDTFLNQHITLSPSNIYVIVADGVKSTTGYNPNKKFTLHIYNLGHEGASVGSTDVLFMNGCTDANALDIRTGIDVLGDNLSYGDFGSKYHTLSATGQHNFRVTNTSGSKTTHNFAADFSTMPVSGKGVVVLTSGFLNPANNSNGDTFGLWMSIPDGGLLIPFTQTDTAEKLARLQFIHNSADTAVGKIDVYINNQKRIDSIDFRNASTYLDVFANPAVKVGIALKDSVSQFFTTTLTIDSGRVYTATLNGIQSDTNYKPLAPLSVNLYSNGKEEATVATNTEVLFMHGATDVPVSGILENNSIPIFTGVNYGSYRLGYYTGTGASTIFAVDTGSNSTLFRQYTADYTSWNSAGKTVTVVYSGFMVPDSNSGGPKFGLWAALPEGGALRELPIYVSVNSITRQGEKINIYPNPAGNEITFGGVIKGHVLIADVTGKVMQQYDNFTGNSVQVGSLVPGNYIFLLQNDKGVLSYSKFIKQ